MGIVIFQNVRNSEIKDENKHHALLIPLIIKDRDILIQHFTSGFNGQTSWDKWQTQQKAINQFLKLANHVSTGMRFKRVHFSRVSKSFQFQLIINAEIRTKMAKDLGAMSRNDRSLGISCWSGPDESRRFGSPSIFLRSSVSLSMPERFFDRF